MKPSIDKSPAWQALAAHQGAVSGLKMRNLFQADPERARKFSIRWNDFVLDYSKNRVTDETMRLLHELARTADVKGWTGCLLGGEPINNTEKRQVLHTALRHKGKPITVDGKDIVAEIKAVRDRMAKFAAGIRDGSHKPHTDTRITDVVHIGIGGSDLGPRMVVEALRPAFAPVRVRFVSSLDDAELAAVLDGLIPATTLFIVASKSFSTQETLANATLARSWLTSALKDEKRVARHFAAVTSRPDAAQKFGIDAENIFPMWDWVGGRYSLWSAIGLPIAIALGPEVFQELLDGAQAMDEHFSTAPLEQNLPVTLALLGIWYANFFKAETHAVLTYDWRLRLVPPWLQQLDMESNGKSVDRDGNPLAYSTGPVIWGGSGSEGQHAFYQLLHQGTHLVTADFIAAAEGGDSRDALMANFLAQTEALMRGSDHPDDEPPYKRYPGNRPTNSILVRRLDARTLGALLAMYEHKVFVQGIIWGINSFDQWGVELGKILAKKIEPSLQDGAKIGDHDASTSGLIEQYRAWRKR